MVVSYHIYSLTFVVRIVKSVDKIIDGKKISFACAKVILQNKVSYNQHNSALGSVWGVSKKVILLKLSDSTRLLPFVV